MHSTQIIAALLVARSAHAAVIDAAKCSSDLQIDNFANFGSLSNSLNNPASDDQSMASIAAADGILKFTPKDVNSYFYETFPCTQAKTQGYGGLQFTLTYPAGADFTLELQTKTDCNAANYTSEWFLISGLTGTQQVVTLDLNVYETSNLDAISGLVYAGFSNTGAFTLSDLKFVCRSLSAREESPERVPRTGPSVPMAAPVETASAIFVESVDSVDSVDSVGVVSYSSSDSPLSAFRTVSAHPHSTIVHRHFHAHPRPQFHGHTFAVTPSSTRRPIVSTTTYRPKPTSAETCTDLLVDDWESQSRLTFLYYNSMYQPSSDDGTMQSIIVSNDNTVTIAPQSTDSYFYSQMPCVDTKDVYGGISLKIKAKAGTSFSVQLASVDKCGSGNYTKTQTLSSDDLGWVFDGTLQAYSLSLQKYPGVDPLKVSMIYFTALSGTVTLGPIAFYCGSRQSEFPVPSHPVNPQLSYQVPAPASTEGSLLIDQFADPDVNALGQWHGCDEDCVTSTMHGNTVKLQTNDSDLAWYSSLADKCADISSFKDSYLHIAYAGSSKFTVSLQQANADCNPDVAPYPETWDSLEAARYASEAGRDIYMPISHFSVDLTRVTTFAFKGFYTTDSTTLSKIEIVPAVPDGFTMPNKLPSGNLVFACKRPNSFAFAIDDGDPALAQEVVDIVKSENINVTFFTVGLPLEDPSTNLSAVYLDMQARGHQIALHSFTHPKMEGLADYAAIDWEYNNDVGAVSRVFSGMHTPYFRPPFGTEGARMRQRLAVALNVSDPYVVMWSVDVEDWRWGTSSTPEKQLDAFKRDLAKGGNLVVMHYLYPNTVKYLRQFIRLAKATGKQLMRVDQCMMDPRAPPL